MRFPNFLTFTKNIFLCGYLVSAFLVVTSDFMEKLEKIVDIFLK